MQAECGVGLGARVGSDALLLAVPGNRNPFDHARAILPPGCHRADILDGRRHDRILHLLVADAVGLERGRRLRRQQREQLEHMVLDEIA
jgi:hypothetical protein